MTVSFPQKAPLRIIKATPDGLRETGAEEVETRVPVFNLGGEAGDEGLGAEHVHAAPEAGPAQLRSAEELSLLEQIEGLEAMPPGVRPEEEIVRLKALLKSVPQAEVEPVSAVEVTQVAEPVPDLQVEAAPVLSNFVGDEQEVVEPASVDPAAVMEREMNAEAVRAAAKTPEEYEEDNRKRTAELLRQRSGMKMVEQPVVVDAEVGSEHHKMEELTTLASPDLGSHGEHNHRVLPMAGVIKYLPFVNNPDNAADFSRLVAAKNQDDSVERLA